VNGSANSASNYGAAVATLPSSFTVTPALAFTARSGAPLNLTLALADALGQGVSFWQDLTVDVSCVQQQASPSALPTACALAALGGSTHAAYFSYSASFPTLTVSGAVHTSFVLSLHIVSPTLPRFGAAGLKQNVSVAVAPCDELEVFDAAQLQCVCAAGSFLDGTSQQCAPCVHGLVSTAKASSACVACPAGFAWVNTSTCVACPAFSKTSPNNPAQCACSAGFYDTTFGSSLAAPACAPCPAGGVCLTGFVAATEGYWRESTRSDVFYRCRVGCCLQEVETAGPLSDLRTAAGQNGTAAARRLLQAAAVVPANCVAGNTGARARERTAWLGVTNRTLSSRTPNAAT
jgi:hypothetical protein